MFSRMLDFNSGICVSDIFIIGDQENIFSFHFFSFFHFLYSFLLLQAKGFSNFQNSNNSNFSNKYPKFHTLPHKCPFSLSLLWPAMIGQGRQLISPFYTKPLSNSLITSPLQIQTLYNIFLYNSFLFSSLHQENSLQHFSSISNPNFKTPRSSSPSQATTTSLDWDRPQYRRGSLWCFSSTSISSNV